MKGQPTKGNRGKRWENKVKVVCNWSYSKETTPSFRRLMLRLLLNDRKGVSDEDR